MRNLFSILCIIYIILTTYSHASDSAFKFRFDARKQVGQEKSVIAARWNGLSPLTLDTDLTEINSALPRGAIKLEATQTYWGSGIDMSLLGGKLLGTGEISGGERLTKSVHVRQKMDAHFYKLGLRSGFGRWSYGIDYQSVGKDYAGLYKIVNRQKKDSSAYHVWLNWHLSDFDFRARFSDSLERKSKKKLNNSQLFDIASGYKLPYLANAHVAISYAFGRQWQTQKYSNQAMAKEGLHQVKATLRHKGTYFAYTLGSNFSWSRPESSSYGWNQIEEYFVNLHYSLHPALVLSPSYRIRSRQYSSQLLKPDKNSTIAQLSVSYQPLKQPYRLIASVNHRTGTGKSEKSVLRARLKLNWTIKHEHRSKKESHFSLSFEQKHHIDHSSGISNTAKLRLMLSWTLLSA